MRNWPDDYENKIHCADCLDVMRDIQDKSIDLVLTDPPYGIGAVTYKRIQSRGNLAVPGNYGKFTWNDKIPDKKYFDEMVRISKNQIIWGGNYFAHYLRPGPGWIVWDKVNGESSFSDCELAWTSFDCGTRMVKYMWSGFLQGKSIAEGTINQGNKKLCEKRIHPTQKPHQLFMWCLNNYSKENDLILDCFSGSGTTAIACHKLNRRFICIEKEPEYVELSRKRLKEEQAQMRLEL